jgi:hypothetical protein
VKSSITWACKLRKNNASRELSTLSFNFRRHLSHYNKYTIWFLHDDDLVDFAKKANP